MKHSFIRSALSTTFLLFLLAATKIDAQATVRRVPTGYPSIQQAINVSINGDTVLVAPGTYIENINFNGKAITVTSESGPQVTVIDGNHFASVVSFTTGENAASVISGFTLRNGRGGFYSGYGGGIDILGASPTVNDNVIINNEAEFQGGGIAVNGGAPTIKGNFIVNNRSGNEAGGIGCGFASSLIQGNTIINNQASTGAGITVRGVSSTQILNNTILNNSASFAGGGIELWSSGPIPVRENVIKGNSAFSQGGGIWAVNFSPALVIQNLIVDNSAYDGGGIYWSNPLGAVLNNTIVYNDSVNASGLSANGFVGNPKVINNIILAKSGRSAVFCAYFGFPPNETVFAFNDIFNPSGVAWDGDCPDQTGINGNISADPLFVSPSTGDYHLRPGSPSIDVGDNSALNLPSTDLDGRPRIQDGNGDGTAVVDMGAYEALPPLPPFNICIQDDSTGSILKFNSTTGDYQFTNCSGFTLSGKGNLIKRGGTITLQDYAADRRVFARIDTSVSKATASIQLLSQSTTFTITDRNTANNTCACAPN